MTENVYTEEQRVVLARELYSTIKQWETRLVRILPDEHSAEMTLSLLTAVILDKDGFGLHEEDRVVTFEALSYTWGSPIFSHRITCNGVKFSVTENLHAALVRLRRPDRERYVWIDALCINQYDLVEKARQIPNMFTIYSKAERTIVWLGESTEDAHEVVERVLDFARSDSRQVDKALGEQIAADCVDLLGRKWLSRVWIIQEIAASQGHGKIEVYYGAARMDWKDYIEIANCSFSSATRDGREIDARVQQGRASLALLNDINIRNNNLWEGKANAHGDEWDKASAVRCLLVLMERSIRSGFQATMEVDHVYSLINVATQLRGKSRGELVTSLPIDYRANLSSILMRLVKVLMNSEQSLEIPGVLSIQVLDLIMTKEQREQHIPPWVFEIGCRSSRYYDRPRQWCKQDPNSQNGLYIAGIRVGDIARVWTEPGALLYNHRDVSHLNDAETRVVPESHCFACMSPPVGRILQSTGTHLNRLPAWPNDFLIDESWKGDVLERLLVDASKVLPGDHVVVTPWGTMIVRLNGTGALRLQQWRPCFILDEHQNQVLEGTKRLWKKKAIFSRRSESQTVYYPYYPRPKLAYIEKSLRIWFLT